jgi:acyl dehydratase
MPIDPHKALGAEMKPVSYEWDPDRIILYHLGIGAGVPQTDPNELAYTYEKNLKVLPSFGVVPAFGSLIGLAAVPGLQFNFAMLLHGEQDIELRTAIPTQAKATTHSRVAEIYDKGKAGLVIVESDTKAESGDSLFVNRFSIFLRGEGGFGGESGPKAGNQPPERAPDAVVESPTLPQQALLYRLLGDKNPLHADPEFSKLGGFETPILHGLCSYGIVCKAVVDNVLGGDPTKLKRYQARFAGVVFPGETIVTSIWKEGERLLLQANTKERSSPVISNSAITL